RCWSSTSPSGPQSSGGRVPCFTTPTRTPSPWKSASAAESPSIPTPTQSGRKSWRWPHPSSTLLDRPPDRIRYLHQGRDGHAHHQERGEDPVPPHDGQFTGVAQAVVVEAHRRLARYRVRHLPDRMDLAAVAAAQQERHVFEEGRIDQVEDEEGHQHRQHPHNHEDHDVPHHQCTPISAPVAGSNAMLTEDRSEDADPFNGGKTRSSARSPMANSVAVRLKLSAGSPNSSAMARNIGRGSLIMAGTSAGRKWGDGSVFNGLVQRLRPSHRTRSHSSGFDAI